MILSDEQQFVMSAFCEVQFSDLELHEKCGAGTSGCVYRAIWKSQKRTVAVKKVLAFNTEVFLP